MRIPLSALPLPLFLLFRQALAAPSRTCLINVNDPFGYLGEQCPAGLPEDLNLLGNTTLNVRKEFYPGRERMERVSLPPIEEGPNKDPPEMTASLEAGQGEVIGGKEEIAFLSFEEWKEKQVKELEESLRIRSQAVELEKDLNARIEQALQIQQQGGEETDRGKTPMSNSQGLSGDHHNDTLKASSSSASQNKQPNSTGSSSAAPHRPTTQFHRYNYASPDCSARIHSAAKWSQNPSSILHKSKDRYMLTPCGAKEHWVVIELCDEIRIEAIEIGMFEFFSGVVREVEISVGGAEESDDDDNSGDVTPQMDEEGNILPNKPEWTSIGHFTSKNVRGTQTFTLSSATSFQRFIRLEFPSYYGSEYYCPISSVKVYGMNQMEAYKWQEKRRRAAEDEERRRAASAVEMERKTAMPVTIIPTALESFDSQTSRALSGSGIAPAPTKQSSLASASPSSTLTTSPVDPAKTESSHSQDDSALASPSQSSSHRSSTKTGKTQAVPLIASESETSEKSSPSSTLPSNAIFSTASPVSSVAGKTGSSTELTEEDQVLLGNSSATNESSLSLDGSPLSDSVKSSSASSSPTTSIVTTSTSTIANAHGHHTPAFRQQSARADSSESIYAYIIRRLDALEGNSTLAALYVEQQARTTQNMLARLENSLNNLQAIAASDLNRTLEIERARVDKRLNQALARIQQKEVVLERERLALKSQLRAMADDIAFEKRRGVAQLIFTLILVILGVFTQARHLEGVFLPLATPSRIKLGRSSSMPQILRPPRLEAKQPQMDREGLPSIGISTAAALDPASASLVRRSPSARTPRKLGTPTGGKPWARSPNGNLGLGRVVTDGTFGDRPRIRFPSGASMNPTRKLARSAHLHFVDAGKLRQEAAVDLGATIRSVPHRPTPIDTSPSEEGEYPSEKTPVVTSRSKWTTVQDATESDDGGISASEVESDFQTDEGVGGNRAAV